PIRCSPGSRPASILFPPARGPAVTQPQSLLGFYWYFVKPIWPVMAALLACSAVYSAIEVSLFAFVGNLVDRMREATSPRPSCPTTPACC
ncbi:MAG: hypothetical protein HC844_18430, partial [Tabrizicola sp.]|nr:hypothetical protein [Tabrizicola sp.]